MPGARDGESADAGSPDPPPERRVESGIRSGLRPLRVVGGVLLSVLLLGGFIAWVGPERVLEPIAAAKPEFLALAVAASLVSVALRTAAADALYRSPGRPTGRRFALVYLATDLPRSFVPGGYAAGPAIVAYALSRDESAEFEPALASLSVAELLNLVSSVSVAGIGAFVLVATFGRGTPQADLLGGVVLGAVVTVLAVVVAVVRYRSMAAASATVARLARSTLGRIPLSRHVRRLTAGRTGERIELLAGTFADLADDRGQLLYSFGLSWVSWTAGVFPLYFGLMAVGAPAGVPTAMVAVPVAGLAALLPLPGGIGGVEVAMAGLVVALAGAAPGTAAAGALLYRLTTFWLEVGLAVLAVGVLGARPTSGRSG